MIATTTIISVSVKPRWRRARVIDRPHVAQVDGERREAIDAAALHRGDAVRVARGRDPGRGEHDRPAIADRIVRRGPGRQRGRRSRRDAPTSVLVRATRLIDIWMGGTNALGAVLMIGTVELC